MESKTIENKRNVKYHFKLFLFILENHRMQRSTD